MLESSQNYQRIHSVFSDVIKSVREGNTSGEEAKAATALLRQQLATGNEAVDEAFLRTAGNSWSS